MPLSPPILTRRRFLEQTFAFSAATAVAPVAAHASFFHHHHGEDLLMLGDWGKLQDDGSQRLVASGMVTYTNQLKLQPKALLMLGDNWYGELADGVDSTRWKTFFEEMYPKSVFDCPAYAILGNHDYQIEPPTVNKVEAELEYAKRGNTRWTMPSRWYTFKFPEKNPLITFIALDSNVGGHGAKPNLEENKVVKFFLTAEQQQEQLRWFQAELEKPQTTPFRVVMGHHPLYSNGPHGDQPLLIREWGPLLHKHKVHLYLAGHDHDMQHLEFDQHPTSFVLSGGGGANLYKLKIDEAARGPYAQQVHGFTHLNVTKDKLTIRHVDGHGQVLHAFSKTAEGKIEIVT